MRVGRCIVNTATLCTNRSDATQANADIYCDSTAELDFDWFHRKATRLIGTRVADSVAAMQHVGLPDRKCAGLLYTPKWDEMITNAATNRDDDWLSTIKSLQVGLEKLILQVVCLGCIRASWSTSAAWYEH